MKVISLVIAFISLTSTGYLAAAQSVTLYTAGPDGLARGIAKSFTEKAASKSTPNRATSGDVLARLDRHGYGHDRRRHRAHLHHRCAATGGAQSLIGLNGSGPRRRR